MPTDKKVWKDLCRLPTDVISGQWEISLLTFSDPVFNKPVSLCNWKPMRGGIGHITKHIYIYDLQMGNSSRQLNS